MEEERFLSRKTDEIEKIVAEKLFLEIPLTPGFVGMVDNMDAEARYSPESQGYEDIYIFPRGCTQKENIETTIIYEVVHRLHLHNIGMRCNPPLTPKQVFSYSQEIIRQKSGDEMERDIMAFFEESMLEIYAYYGTGIVLGFPEEDSVQKNSPERYRFFTDSCIGERIPEFVEAVAFRRAKGHSLKAELPNRVGLHVGRLLWDRSYSNSQIIKRISKFFTLTNFRESKRLNPIERYILLTEQLK